MTTQVQAKLQQGLALHQQGQLAQAQALYQQVLALQPQHFDALHLLGVCAMQTKRYEEAVALLEQALAIDPCHAQAHYNYGNALQELQQFAAAIASYDQAIALEPNYAVAYSNRGNALQELQQFAAAVASYDRAIAFNPDCTQTYYNRGNAFKELKQFDAAITSYDRAIALNPSHVQAHSNRGVALKELGQFDAAVASHNRAIALKPDQAQAYYNRGNALQELRQFDAAITSYDQAIALNPNDAQVYYNRGNALKKLQQFDAAIASYDQAVVLAPDYAQAHWNKALSLLLKGKYMKGWQLYAWRWKVPDLMGTVRQFPQPQWSAARTYDPSHHLLIWGEQGPGDQILFLSMLDDIATRVQKITVAVEPRLMTLVQRSFPQVQVVALSAELEQAPVDSFDSQIPMGELGQFVRTCWEDFPLARRSYLVADPVRCAQFRADLPSQKPLVCGISWFSQNAERGPAKSIRLQDLKPVLTLNDFQWVDLQYGDTRAERMALQTQLAIDVQHIDGMDNFTDLDDLAALIDACDVVLTVSNTTAHMAGALGKTVYLMLPYADGLLWYWHEGRDDSPWYPSVKLYRQQSPGDWAGVIERVAADLHLAVQKP